MTETKTKTEDKAAEAPGPRNIPIIYLVDSFASKQGDEVRVDKETADRLVSLNVARRKSDS